MGLASCVPTRAYRFSDRAGLHLPFHRDRFPMSFNLTLSGKHFICPSILSDSFAGYSNLGCRSLPFMTLNTSFQPFLACKISFEKSLIVFWELLCR